MLVEGASLGMGFAGGGIGCICITAAAQCGRAERRHRGSPRGGIPSHPYALSSCASWITEAAVLVQSAPSAGGEGGQLLKPSESTLETSYEPESHESSYALSENGSPACEMPRARQEGGPVEVLPRSAQAAPCASGDGRRPLRSQADPSGSNEPQECGVLHTREADGSYALKEPPDAEQTGA